MVAVSFPEPPAAPQGHGHLGARRALSRRPSPTGLLVSFNFIPYTRGARRRRPSGRAASDYFQAVLGVIRLDVPRKSGNKCVSRTCHLCDTEGLSCPKRGHMQFSVTHNAVCLFRKRWLSVSAASNALR